MGGLNVVDAAGRFRCGPYATKAIAESARGILAGEKPGEVFVTIPTPATRLYSWRADRKAAPAHIRHFVADAVARKQWAQSLPAKWWKGASTMSQEMAAEYASYPVRTMARKAMEYARQRAFMRSGYEGWPGDKPAHDLWQALANGTPVRYYDSLSGQYVEKVGGAA